MNTYLSVILIHHPPNWFVEHEDPNVARMIEADHDFLLHGHEHLGWVDEKNGHIRIAAAACYAKGSMEESGYNFVRLNLDTGTGRSWLRQFDSLGGAWIPRVIARKTDDHGIWPFVWRKRAQGAVGPSDIKTIPVAGAKAVTPAPELLNDRVRQVVLPVEPIGRKRELDECVALLRSTGVLLLHGAPGQGKTALARYVAASSRNLYRDGIFEIDLQNERKLENLPKHIAAAIGGDEDSFAFELLKDKNALLILDSFETLLRSTEREQVSRFFDHLLVAASGQSRIVVTSRDSLEKEGVLRKRVRPLEVPPAVELFLRETDGLYESTDAEDIAEFVQADLGCHALSIKLVARFAALAARVDLRSLRDLWRLRFNEIAKFESSLDLKPLAAALELTYESLSEVEKRFFLALALLPDGLLGSHVAEIWKNDVTAAYTALGVLEQRSLLESEQHYRRILGPLLLYAQMKRRAIGLDPAHPLHTDLAADAEAVDAFYDVLVSRHAPQETDEDPAEKNLTIRRFFYNIHASFDRRLDPSTSVRNLAAAESVVRLYWAYHNNLVGTKGSLGTADDALHYLDKAYQIFRINEQHDRAVLCRYYVGNILWLRGDIPNARVRLEDVLNSPHAADKLKYNARRAFAHIEYKSGSIANSAVLYEEVAKEAVKLKFPRRQPEVSFSINHLRWISGLGF